MRIALSLILVLSSVACWKTDDQYLNYQTIRLDNEYVDQEIEVFVQTFITYTLTCPDEEPARFYVVYRSDISPDPDVAIVFHSGAFDYVQDPQPGAPLEGQHYVQGDNRLLRSWASTRVFSTLGMWEAQVEPYEIQTGTLTAVLAEHDKLAIYPIDCWGDLWHNEAGRQDNDWVTDDFTRNGAYMAWWILRMLVDQEWASAQGIQLPVEIDVADPASSNGTPRISLIGLGDGGRAVSELLWRMSNSDLNSISDLLDAGLLPRIHSVLLDSTPDDLTPYQDNPYSTQAYDQEGLSRIFYNDPYDISHYSLAAYLDSMDPNYLGSDSLPLSKVMLLYSGADPAIRADSLTTLVDLLENYPSQGAGEDTGSSDTGGSDTGSGDTGVLDTGQQVDSGGASTRMALPPSAKGGDKSADLQVYVEDLQLSQHVFSNNNLMLALEVVDYLFDE